MSTPQSSALSQADFVTGDVNALALHMRDCARAHGRMFSLRSGMQRVHSIAAGRIVTVAFAALVIALGMVALA
ncbi:hypothetical protein [Variovorax sp. PAMC 28711]|uniref:hypothetical protein n=1 Tax=Variovorax sp. PAMC 28711 TaxID=1795631 RepID=UPI0009EA40DD|nr:hypothetical protein [Variovorax sp. PAMC 28711]